MKIPWTLSLGGLCLVCQGCSPLGHAARTSIIEPLVCSRYVNEVEDCTHDYQLAKEALARYQADHPEKAYSPDFCLGFKKGYADYLYAGGKGNPPPVPPRCYWNSKYESIEGHQAIGDWFAGFREGAAVAKQSGLRDLVTVPPSVGLAPSFPPPLPSHPAPALSLPASPEPDPVLPQPRPVQP
jgi:hypothetical protein